MDEAEATETDNFPLQLQTITHILKMSNTKLCKQPMRGSVSFLGPDVLSNSLLVFSISTDERPKHS